MPGRPGRSGKGKVPKYLGISLMYIFSPVERGRLRAGERVKA